ncbi:DUF1850 domain-containing protein [Anaeromicrobium sediminis]|uniref:DUF1850 domain-containing protein n=1 Tax=Anaeromicrobium sediminis TaxID=1478221 RepID=A0A267MJT5_9FIRM|nr:DUF1850 domain-containing protein [Anaeromicrobium sediminis]PAB59178.1 hypothetical protein CCE28_11710 [Anaeromicrobium sediminis]
MKKTFLILALLALILFSYNMTVLEVFVADKGVDNGKILLRIPVKTGRTFEVNWIHSVSKRPVIEKYEIQNNLKIAISEMKFDTFSANLPARPDYDTKWEYKDNYIRVYNYNMEFDEVPVVIGEVIADHIICIKNNVVYLRQLYRPGGFVKIRVKKMNLIKYMAKEGVR